MKHFQLLDILETNPFPKNVVEGDVYFDSIWDVGNNSSIEIRLIDRETGKMVWHMGLPAHYSSFIVEEFLKMVIASVNKSETLGFPTVKDFVKALSTMRPTIVSEERYETPQPKAKINPYKVAAAGYRPNRFARPRRRVIEEPVNQAARIVYEPNEPGAVPAPPPEQVEPPPRYDGLTARLRRFELDLDDATLTNYLFGGQAHAEADLDRPIPEGGTPELQPPGVVDDTFQPDGNPDE